MQEISLHLLDIARNSIEAGATRVEILIEEDLQEDVLRLEVLDNGSGMNEETLRKIVDPFFTTKQKGNRVGLGIPLLQAATQRCDGKFSIKSSPGQGTTVSACFRHSHIDRMPLGNIPGTIALLLTSGKEVDILYTHRIGGKEMVFDSAEIRRRLDGLPIYNPVILEWVSSYLEKELEDLNGGAEYEVSG